MRQEYALITGASSGLGAEFALQLAEKGHNLILTARRKNHLNRLKVAIERKFESSAGDTDRLKSKPKIQIIAADLSSPKGVTALIKAVSKKKLSVNFLINNAGYGYYGEFGEKDYTFWENMIHVNLNALVALTNAFLPKMKAENFGKILFVSSVAGFMPIPFFTVYAALKSSVLHFGEALAEELRGSGVSVAVLCPGPTATEFFDVATEGAGVKLTSGYARPADVVKQGLDGLDKGKTVIVPGLLNKIQVIMPRFGSRRITARIAGIVIQKMRK